MAKKKKSTIPTIVNTYIPVYIPTEGGAGELALGTATMKANVLVIEFNEKIPSVAIQRRIARGEIVGVTFVIPPDEAEEARESEAQREQDLRDAADLELLQSDESYESDDKN